MRRRPEISTTRGPRRAIAVRTVVVLLVATACTSEGDDNGERSAGPEVTSQRGGTLRAAVTDDWLPDVADLDPQRNYGFIGWQLFRCCLLRTLYSFNGKPIEEGGAELRPDLAAGLPEVSADGLTWTFRLQQGLRYAPPFDDTQIVALDIVRALERMAHVGGFDAEGGYPFYYSSIRGFDDYAAGDADSIAGLETPDVHVLVVRLDQVTSDLAFRFSLAATAPIPEGAADGHDEDYGRFLVASGPYMIEGSADLDFTVPPDQQEPAAGSVPPALTAEGALVDRGSLVLVRNPSWDPSTHPLRAAFPDRIELTLGGDQVELANRVDAGEIDLVLGSSSPAEQVARYREDPELTERVFVHRTDGLGHMTLNLAVPPFDDVHVRRAVSFAIDKEAFVGMLSRLADQPADTQGQFGFISGEAATHIAADELERSLLAAFDPYPYDPSRALAEMRSSAYDQDGDGRCDGPACRDVTALVNTGVILPEQARAIRDAFAGLGIELVLEDLEVNPFFQRLSDVTQRIPVGIGAGWASDFPAGGGWFPGLFDASALEGEDPCCNWSLVGASPARLDDWGYSVTTVPNVDDRFYACMRRAGVASTDCWVEFDQYLMTEVVPWVPLIFLERTQVVSERVVRYSFDQATSMPALDRIALASASE